MDARSKALYRSKLKAATQKREKRIDSPLVRYNEQDQPVCRVCDVLLKSEINWAAHQVSRKHHEAIENVKAKAAGKTKTNVAIVEPSSQLINKSRLSSTLPPDFFDKNDSKKQKTGLAVGDKIVSGAPSFKANNKSMDLGSSMKNQEKIKSDSQTHHVESFHPPMDNSLNSQKDDTELKVVKGALPEGFFDNPGSRAANEIGKSKVEQSHRKDGVSDVKQVKGSLPEGFFDNKDSDLRARGIEPVKLDMKDEYKEFEKLIQEDLQVVDARLGEEEIDAAEVIKEEETWEQRACRERLETLRKQRMELKSMKLDKLKAASIEKDSSDEDTSSDEDEDENAGNFAVDWRAKHL